MRERKSVRKEITLERDLTDRSQMEAILVSLPARVEGRRTDLELIARTLSLKVRWSDFQLIMHSISRAQMFRSAWEMLSVLRTLLSQLGSEQRSVRLLGVSVSNLMPARRTLQGQLPTTFTLWDDN